MLFNSHVFILLFLPITLAGYFLLGRLADTRPVRLWLLLASLAFYGWWSPAFRGLLAGSMLANYALGHRIGALRTRAPGPARVLMLLGVAANIGLLAWYKYATFIVGNIAALTGLEFAVGGVVLPLAISFYTFPHLREGPGAPGPQDGPCHTADLEVEARRDEDHRQLRQPLCPQGAWGDASQDRKSVV